MATACPTSLSTERRDASALVVCLAGNPNVGKSTLFNRLTGSAVETANYPGMTVGLNVASASWGGQEVQLVDLPGTYALDPVSDDQWVARHGLLDWRPDVVVAVVDATNLARNLYLVLQIVDLGRRVVVALNLVDEARRQSLRVDPHALSAGPGSARDPHGRPARRGTRRARRRGHRRGDRRRRPGPRAGGALLGPRRAEVAGLEATFADRAGALPEGLPPRAAALALLAGDRGARGGARRRRRGRRPSMGRLLRCRSPPPATRPRRPSPRPAPRATRARRPPIAGGRRRPRPSPACRSCWPCWRACSPFCSSSAAGCRVF